MRRSRLTGFDRIRIAPTWAIASVRIVEGRTGRWPLIERREIALVDRDVLHADDPLVRLVLHHAIDQQEWIPMRKDALDGRVVERQYQMVVGIRHGPKRQYTSLLR